MCHRFAFFSKLLLGPLGLVLIASASGVAWGAPQDPPKYSNQRSEAAGRAMLDRFRQRHPTREAWEQVASEVRRSILKEAGLAPLPRRQPLSPIVHSRRSHDGYTVENVAIETLPGYFATGNLYRPAAGDGPFPLVLCPHGHYHDSAGKLCGRVIPDTQQRCAVLARLGAVVFSIDMVGAVDATQLDHGDRQAFTVQLWNNMRALDYLTSLHHVDPQRIGVTGSSGGGSQTVMLTALDPRVTVSVPVVMVSAHFDGGCTCESGLPVFQSVGHETNLAQVAALAAPRPQLLVSCGGDWTKNTPQVEYPYLREIYSLYGKPDQVENAHFASEGHDYAESKRQAVYPFLAKHLGLDIKSLPRLPAGGVDEAFVTVETPEQMHVFDAAHPRPLRAIQGSKAVAEALSAARPIQP